MRSHHDNSNCTWSTCTIEDSPFNYRPSLALNGLLIVLFSIALIFHIIQGVRFKTWGFLAAMSLGCAAEIIGYGGRIWAYHNPFTANPFLIQICCLTFAPAFFAAGIYLCLSRIVVVFGKEISRIPPKGYTYIFIGCDFFSLVLQGAGGGIASVSSQNGKSPAPGTHVMLAGLSFQVFTLALFITFCAEYAFRVIRTETELNRTHAKLRASKKFRGFLCALSLSTIFILIRSVYRVIEMAQGWDGGLIANQTLFFVLEGVMVILAVGVLNFFHPGWCFQEGYSERSGKSEEEMQSDL